MRKSIKITIVFILIFVIGVLSFVASINHSLNTNVSSSLPLDPSSSRY